MEILINPARSQWQTLAERPLFDLSSLFAAVQPILEQVRNDGDEALRRLEERFDKARLTTLAVPAQALQEAESELPPSLCEAIRLAHHNITAFHAAQRFSPITVETQTGIVCQQRAVPIERVGLYIPGGTAPLFSTVLMLAIPATIAGCSEIVLCTPPSPDGSINAAIRFAAHLCGVTKVFSVGGAQAIAAMAYGTESIPRVDKIFGPGNQYVMAAKQLVSLSHVAIDMPAGPSEVEVLADTTCRPEFVAADLLSQAEHGVDSQAVLVTTDKQVAEQVAHETALQLSQLPRRDIAQRSIDNSRILVFENDMASAIDFTNLYAPEHLIIATENYHAVADQIRNAGSVFLGNFSCESAGDYASGTNHTLPTKAWARSYSGLSLDSFQRKMTLQELRPEALAAFAPAVEAMAAAEQLDAHRKAMYLRRIAAQDALGHE
ncbi:MAG: histidinol dehydrogenase [Bacteroidaceae bacterium]|nr:histidinol dehydrogenase [Bacteroidaceae bacterium]